MLKLAKQALGLWVLLQMLKGIKVKFPVKVPRIFLDCMYWDGWEDAKSEAIATRETPYL